MPGQMAFILAGACIACAGFALVLYAVWEFRRDTVTARNIENWRWRVGKQGLTLPRNVPLESVAAYVRVWRRWTATHKFGLGIALFLYGIATTIINILNATASGDVASFQYFGVGLYTIGVTTAFLGLFQLPRSHEMRGQTAERRSLRHYRYPFIPALCIALVLSYCLLILVVIVRLARGFDPSTLSRVLMLPGIDGVIFGLLASIAAIAMTEIISRRIVALPPIPLPPTYGWERVANTMLRTRTIAFCSGMTWWVTYIATMYLSMQPSFSLIERSGMSGWCDVYVVLVMMSGLVVLLFTQYIHPAPRLTSERSSPAAAEQPS